MKRFALVLVLLSGTVLAQTPQMVPGQYARRETATASSDLVVTPTAHGYAILLDRRTGETWLSINCKPIDSPTSPEVLSILPKACWLRMGGER